MLIVHARRHLKQVLWSRLSEHGLTPPQFWILMVLREQGSMSLHEVASRICSDDPTTSRVVRTLQEKGLVESLPDPGHGRRIRLSLSAQGRKLAPQLKRLLDHLRKDLQNCLDNDEERILRQALTKIITRLRMT